MKKSVMVVILAVPYLKAIFILHAMKVNLALRGTTVWSDLHFLLCSSIAHLAVSLGVREFWDVDSVVLARFLFWRLMHWRLTILLQACQLSHQLFSEFGSGELILSLQQLILWVFSPMKLEENKAVYHCNIDHMEEQDLPPPHALFQCTVLWNQLVWPINTM